MSGGQLISSAIATDTSGKLAAEVVESANAHFRAQAQVLISKLDKLELSLHQDS